MTESGSILIRRIGETQALLTSPTCFPDEHNVGGVVDDAKTLSRVSRDMNDVIFTIEAELLTSWRRPYCRIDCTSRAINREPEKAVQRCTHCKGRRVPNHAAFVGRPVDGRRPPRLVANRLTASGSYRLMTIYCLAALFPAGSLRRGWSLRTKRVSELGCREPRWANRSASLYPEQPRQRRKLRRRSRHEGGRL